MAKTKSGEERDPLADPMRAFLDGNYVRARAEFQALRDSARLSELERATADQLAGATSVDRVTLWVEIACLALFLVAATLTGLIQP